jgi:hypothetical protein
LPIRTVALHSMCGASRKLAYGSSFEPESGDGVSDVRIPFSAVRMTPGGTGRTVLRREGSTVDGAGAAMHRAGTPETTAPAAGPLTSPCACTGSACTGKQNARTQRSRTIRDGKSGIVGFVVIQKYYTRFARQANVVSITACPTCADFLTVPSQNGIVGRLPLRWRNWQTRTFEGRVEQSIGVQAPS